MKKMAGWLIALLWPLQAGALGVVYAGSGGDGREFLELSSVAVDVSIQDRVAVTRADQVFTNHSDRVLEGIYEFVLPPGAIITDLVLWIGEKRVQGLIMEKEAARRTYDEIVGRRIDPALVEQVGKDRFRLSIFPFPAQGSRRVELEYMQVLESRRGVMPYRFPLAPETGEPLRMELFVLNAEVRGQYPLEVAVPGAFQALTQIEQPDEFSAAVFFGDEKVSPERDFELIVREVSEDRRPVVLSRAPRRGDEGYYALWLPPLQELAVADPVPRSLTFVIDVSSSMLDGKLGPVKAALTAAIEDLQSEDFFNIVVFSSGTASFAERPISATPQNREEAMRFIREQGALGVTNFEAALQEALQQAFPAGRLNHILFLTDGRPTIGEKNLLRLSQMVEDLGGELIRLFTIGVGRDVNRDFLQVLAEEHRGSASFLSEEEDIEAALRALFEELTRPIFLPEDLVFEGLDIQDAYPRGVELLAVGQELFQVGRYRGGGAFTLKLKGRMLDRDLSLEYPLEVAPAEVDLPSGGEETMLLDEGFEDGRAQGCTPSPGAEGSWEVDGDQGVYRVADVDGISRSHYPVEGSDYTIETRLRFGGWEGKVIYMMADQHEAWRLDLINDHRARLQTPAGLFAVPFTIFPDVWYEVRLEVGNGVVNTYVNGIPVHVGIPLGGVVPDGVIGVGSYGTTHQAEFDYVRVFEGVGGGSGYAGADPVARLWAHQKVQALEAQIARYGVQQELLDDILRLGLYYRLVTRMTSLFAPDDEVIVDPIVGEDEDEGGVASAVEESAVTASWLGKSFYLRDDVWIDADLRPGMEIKDYDPAAGQPAELGEFARLNQHLIVVAQGQAYRLYRGARPASPVLQQNMPNPFNASTLIPYQIPAGMEREEVRLTIYNLAGQRVRVLKPEGIQVGENHLRWDGKDDQGVDVSSGVYVYRLKIGDTASSRRMVLVR